MAEKTLAGKTVQVSDDGYLVDSAQWTKEIESEMEQFYDYAEDNKPKLLEISTPSDLNPIVLKDFFNTIRQS